MLYYIYLINVFFFKLDIWLMCVYCLMMVECLIILVSEIYFDMLVVIIIVSEVFLLLVWILRRGILLFKEC